MDEGVVRGDQPEPLSRTSSRKVSDARNGAFPESSTEEGDYCRICRGDSSQEEPLFYPCRCSGSIKFVHQACLMEWLSHSQKKYCELCKTPFRFTKLYDPDMPGRLPTPIFARQMFVHIAKGLLTWSRFVLVGLVWLAWLPWSMRQVWRVLFYLIDCRWSAQYASPQPPVYPSIVNSTNSSVAFQSLNATDPVSHRNLTLQQGVIRVLPQLLAPLTALLGASNSQFVLLRLVQTMFPGFFRWTQSISADYAVNTSSDGQPIAVIYHRPTLLGEINTLKSLTTSPTINNSIIDILEGQVICLSLVVVSILLFLIREWVINQQPAVAANPEIAAPAPNAQADRPAEVAVVQDHPADHPVEQADTLDNIRRAILDVAEQDSETNQTPLASPVNDSREGNDGDGSMAVNDSTPSDTTGADDEGDSSGRSSRTRPPLTGRNAMNDATSIRRSIEEHNDLSAAWPGLDTFKDLWSRADSNPSNVLKIIDEEGRKDELAWIVSQMERLQRESRFKSSSHQASERFSKNDESTLQMDEGAPADLPTLGPRNLTQRGDEQEREVASESPEDKGIWAAEPGRKLWTFGEENERVLDTPAEPALANFPPLVPENTEPSELNTDAIATVSSDPVVEEHEENSVPNPLSDANQTFATEVEPPRSILEAIKEWFWANDLYQRGQEDQLGEDDEHVIEDVEQEAPFVPVQPQEPAAEVEGANAPQPAAEAPRDPEVAAAAAEAGIDLNNPDAAEDLEDLEGIMELIGLQGPITGLIQNVVFSQFLISLTLLTGVGIPYVWGMLALHVVSHPVSVFVKFPVAVMASIIDLAVDTTLFATGLLLSIVFLALSATVRFLIMVLPPLSRLANVSKGTSISYALVSRSGVRLEKTLTSLLVGDGINLPELTISAHRSLHGIEKLLSEMIRCLGQIVSRCVLAPPLILNNSIWTAFKKIMRQVTAYAIHLSGHTRTSITHIRQLPRALSAALATLDTTAASSGRDDTALPDIPAWTARDRAVAVALGYASIIVLGFVYLRVARLVLRLRKEEKVEGIVADIVRQAGGVLKVVLIIGIEMIVFPFYCGILLDVALLPLFKTASLEGRMVFFKNSPLVALFVHWFIGTCYMFHFALFVSMCRKIMRTGVLYFIRDPDDPTFHPVRDVLERSVATQLSKIAFSALVYGALVMFCLGGVVWGISTADGILPIHWASGGPVLEFPIDLIFYSFVLPMLLRNIQPSKKINKVYKWWFRSLASWLRLTDFLFGERKEEEQGRHVRRTWLDFFRGMKGDVKHPVIGEDRRVLMEDRQLDVFFVRDGKFVRTPASDSVRIPKAQAVFVEVSEANERLDGQPDVDEGAHGKKNKDFAMVYIPPWFRLRIALFVGFVWIFTAIFGTCLTIIPLLVGRKIINILKLSSDEPNDLYAFTLGFSLAVGMAYCITRVSIVLHFFKTLRSRLSNISSEVIIKALATTKHALGLLYLASYVGLVLPMVLAILAECYAFIPLHTYLTSPTSLEDVLRSPYLLHGGIAPPHNIHAVQTWLLGVLLLRIALRLALTTPNHRTLVATALKSVIAPPHHSLLNPNVTLATRAFVLPSLVLSTFLFAAPLSLGWLINQTPRLIHQPPEVHAIVYRYSFPGVSCIAGIAWCAVLLQKAVEKWRIRIRDEVYLVGERLHNFGERRSSRSKRESKGKGRADTRDNGDVGGGGGRLAVL